MLRVIKPGLQSTLQGAPRIGSRHFGMPYAGPADAVSMALANRLVGNDAYATCLEITYGGFEAEVESACAIAVTGADGGITVSGVAASPHVTQHVKGGDHIHITPPETGARTYLAVRSGFQASEEFGSTSTYLPAGLGGYEGRALRVGDILRPNGVATCPTTTETPITVRPVFTGALALRTCVSAETSLLSEEMRAALFETNFVVGRQPTRMGMALTGRTFKLRSADLMKSAPVFPGTIQCPPSGVPIVLLCDAQTTGGYPRIASIARCDRHLLGQARPGDHVRLLRRSPEEAIRDYKAKKHLIDSWLKS